MLSRRRLGDCVVANDNLEQFERTDLTGAQSQIACRNSLHARLVRQFALSRNDTRGRTDSRTDSIRIDYFHAILNIEVV